MKILLVGAELLNAEGRTERQTDMMNLIVAFCHFEKVPKNDYFKH